MNINQDALEQIIQSVINKMEGADTAFSEGIFDTIDMAIDSAYIAQREFMNCSMADKQKYIDAIKIELGKEENIKMLSQMAVDETGMGNYEDKCAKNALAVNATPGTEDLVTNAIAGDDGLTLLEQSPFGVIGSITPTTNPSETVICNSIGMLAAGNSVVFAPHPRSLETSLTTIKLINKALAEAGAPKNLITAAKTASLENTDVLMSHDKIKLLCATGGPGIVKAVLSSGKKAIGAGAGNPPVVVDETADIEKAGRDIVLGASFDNNLPCIAEKEIIVVDSVADYLIYNMKLNGAYEIKDMDVINKLEKLVTTEKGTPKSDFVGKSALYILGKLGIIAPSDTKLIIFEIDRDSTFVIEELMMPIVPVVRVNDCDEAIDLAVKVENGNRHTAIMHSKNIDNLSKMGKLIQTTIFIKNAPSYTGIGAGGEGYTTFTIAGPTGEGLTSAKTFTRKRRCVLVNGFDIR